MCMVGITKRLENKMYTQTNKSANNQLNKIVIPNSIRNLTGVKLAEILNQVQDDRCITTICFEAMREINSIKEIK